VLCFQAAVNINHEYGSLKTKNGNRIRMTKPVVTARSFCHHFAFILSLWRMPK